MEKELPPELITEIFLWLPAKSLGRFRCASKSWHSLLTVDTAFIQSHYHRAIEAQNPSLLLHNGGAWTDKFHNVYDYTALDSIVKLRSPFYMWRVNIPLGVCNGLLYFRHFPFFDDGHCTLYVWNPLTGDHTTIQCPPRPSDFPDRFGVTFGFGYCEGTNKYKAIRILCTPCNSPLPFRSHVSVYTLGEDSWKILEGIPYHIFQHEPAALVGGAFHWLGIKPGSSLYDAVVSLSLRDEIFQEIPLPKDVICCNPHHLTINELSGILHMFYHIPAESIQVWVMKEYGEVNSWEKLFKTEASMFPGPYRNLIPQCVTNKGDIILVIDIEEGGSSLVLYNPKTNSISNLEEIPVLFTEAYSYVGSLISPQLINGAMIVPESPSKVCTKNY